MPASCSKADEGPGGPAWTDARIAEALEISVRTVERVRTRCVAEGLAAALEHRPPARHRPAALGRRAGGPSGRAGLRRSADGARPLDAAAAGGPTGRVGGRRGRLVRDGPGARSKKRAQAVADRALVHPAQGSGEFVCRDGGRARRLHPPLRSPRPAGLPGRDQQAAARRGPPTRSRCRGPPATRGRRVRAQRDGLDLPVLRAAHRLAPRRKRASAARGSTGRTRSGSWSTSTTPRPSGSCWSWTT